MLTRISDNFDKQSRALDIVLVVCVTCVDIIDNLLLNYIILF